MTAKKAEPAPQRLGDVVGLVASAESPESAMQGLLKGALSMSGATRGRLYLLDLAEGTYDSVAAVSRGPGAKGVRPATFRGSDPASLAPLERATVERTAQIIASPDSYAGPPLAETYGSRLIVPIVRRTTCLGMIDLDAREPGFFSSDSDIASVIEPLAQLATTIYESRFLLRLLRESQEPIDFTLNEADFNQQIMTLVALSSQMEYAALREFTEDEQLRCIGTYGFGPQWEDETFDISDLDEVEPFAEVVRTHSPHVAHNMSAERYAPLRGREELSDVRSFVAVPVLVGHQVFGVLSFGSSLEYDYAEYEVAGLQSVANGIGVAIENHRNFHAASIKLAAYESTATAITAMEVAQAARHEARGIIDNCVVELLALDGKLMSASSTRKPEILNHVQSLESRLEGLGTVLDKIKVATKAPARARATVGLRQVWEEAKSQLAGKIGQARVESCDYVGPDVPVYVAIDWFRQVFINLMLNSLDAFIDGSANRRGRKMRLVVERPSDRQLDYVLTYTDNAGGINPSALRRLDGKPISKPLEDVIFDPDVTSKAEGSGWGLALVRRILTDHRGSISMIDHRGGTTFRITLPIPVPTKDQT